ncbi:hypothetical protein COOONC_12595, partial [Cooperia oncophora]
LSCTVDHLRIRRIERLRNAKCARETIPRDQRCLSIFISGFQDHVRTYTVVASDGGKKSAAHGLGRYHRSSPITAHFRADCAAVAGENYCIFTITDLGLPITLPPILDNIAWFVGRWECKTTQGENFPEALSGPYREILEVQISDVPMFDRPPVNIRQAF